MSRAVTAVYSSIDALSEDPQSHFLEYGPFGEITNSEGLQIDPYLIIKQTGSLIDSDTRLVLKQGQWQDPENGRFITENKLSRYAGQNRYGVNDTAYATDWKESGVGSLIPPDSLYWQIGGAVNEYYESVKEDPSELFGEGLHVALDIIGLVPGIGVAADLFNAAIYIYKRRWAEAAVSGFAAIPLAGYAVAGAQGTKYGIKLSVAAASRLSKASRALDVGINVADNMEET